MSQRQSYDWAAKKPTNYAALNEGTIPYPVANEAAGGIEQGDGNVLEPAMEGIATDCDMSEEKLEKLVEETLWDNEHPQKQLVFQQKLQDLESLKQDNQHLAVQISALQWGQSPVEWRETQTLGLQRWQVPPQTAVWTTVCQWSQTWGLTLRCQCRRTTHWDRLRTRQTWAQLSSRIHQQNAPEKQVNRKLNQKEINVAFSTDEIKLTLVIQNLMGEVTGNGPMKTLAPDTKKLW